MQLVADRFVVDAMTSATFARDLATNETVWLDVRAAGDAGEQRRWAITCDQLFLLRHPAIATLVDYGLVGRDQRFEAWSARPDWHADARCAADGASARVLERCTGEGTNVVPGIRLVSRPSVNAIAEMLRIEAPGRPRAAALWGAKGSGVATAIVMLAREGRLRGFVPIDASLLVSDPSRVPAGRSLFVIGRTSGSDAARALLRAALRSPLPHVCLAAGREEVAGLDGFDIGRVDRDALVRCVTPSSERIRRRAERAADAARGLPAAFARALWATDRAGSGTSPLRSRVAERAPAYGGSTLAPERDTSNAETDDAAWMSSDERAAIRRKIAQAEELLAAGRHAPGLRLLRQEVAALVRRQLWSDAADGSLTLARHLLARGRARDTLRILSDVKDRAGRAGSSALSEAAFLSGHSWIDLGRLADAECALRAAVTHARAARDPARVAALIVALSRSLFWRGEYAEAAVLLDNNLAPSAASEQAAAHRQSARVAAAQGDASRALALLDRACRTASQVGVSSVADAEYTAAFVRLLIGDLDGVDTAVQRTIEAARAARRPMRVLSATLLQAEADRRRRGALSAARSRTLERMVRTAPPLLRIRWELIKRLTGARDEPAAAAALAASSGVGALTLFAPASRAGTCALDPLVREVVEIVHACHDADEERHVLNDVCARVRQQLHAAAVAFLAADAGRWDVVGCAGPRMDPEIAARAVGSGVVASPCRIRDRLEAAAPVLYGGRPIAALCARWVPGAGDELARAAAVLSIAASAAAPVVHAALAHRDRPCGLAVPDLIGQTSAMSELRRAVERAGAAPFPVLIEGESGSGKELVARGIHRAGPRRDRPFCALNCAALPDELAESELFGHARGSFTGAMGDRPGVFEEAHGGTLFLDEIGELSLRAQAKLLRVVQEGELRRIGENISRRIDVRIVCATNRDLRREAEGARFRTDLLYRLDVIRVSVPPLRERREDVAVLLDHFWGEATRRIGSRATLSTAARAVLGSYDWPGNVRELQNVLAALAVRSPKRGVIPPHALPAHIASARRPDAWRLDAARRTFEEAFVRAALVRAGGQRNRAAAELGLTRQGLTKLMSRLGIRE